MKAIFCFINGSFEMDLEAAAGIPGKNIGLIVSGYNDDKSRERSMGMSVYREELYSLPKFEGFAGPMWDGDGVRYETPEAYESYSL